MASILKFGQFIKSALNVLFKMKKSKILKGPWSFQKIFFDKSKLRLVYLIYTQFVELKKLYPMQFTNIF